MTVRKFGRRWMLIGGGAALAIPALPSLLRPSRARAQDGAAPRRMVVFNTEHGGIWNETMYPATLPSQPLAHPLHTVHQSPLTSRLEGSERVISDLLRAPASSLSEALVGKMNLLRGMDVPFYYGHARHSLGNYGRMSNDNTGPEDRETADRVLARTALYDGVPRQRVMNFSYQGLSIELTNPGAGPSGGVQPTAEVSAQAVFDAVFVPDVGPSDEPPRPPPIDAVFESYQRLQSGAFGPASRLGRADRQRLERYMDRLSDIRAALSSGVGAQCSDVVYRDDYPGTSRYTRDNYQLINTIITAGFMCDSSRLAVIRPSDDFDTGAESDGGFHEVAHNAASLADEGRSRRLAGILNDANRRFFREAFLDLVTKLDGISEGTGTMLDQSLVWWVQEAGPKTHDGDSIPVVTAGSAGGRFNTGQYFDFRDRGPNSSFLREEERILSNEGRQVGICFFQWTTTYLDAFGVPREAWQVPGRTAFSGMIPPWHDGYDQAAMDRSCSEPIPGLLAA
ncbi:MAG: DUF1552 domain-containing protein [Myxococcota bacterium]